MRLGFHDAATWSKSLAAAGQDFGGADGSLALFNEDTRAENAGLGPVTNLARDLYARYGIGMGDLIQYMSIHATVTCPLGPRLRAYVGRVVCILLHLSSKKPLTFVGCHSSRSGGTLAGCACTG